MTNNPEAVEHIEAIGEIVGASIRLPVGWRIDDRLGESEPNEVLKLESDSATCFVEFATLLPPDDGEVLLSSWLHALVEDYQAVGAMVHSEAANPRHFAVDASAAIHVDDADSRVDQQSHFVVAGQGFLAHATLLGSFDTMELLELERAVRELSLTTQTTSAASGQPMLVKLSDALG